MNHEPCLDFFQRRYHWSSRDKSAGTTYSLSLEEVIENEKVCKMQIQACM